MWALKQREGAAVLLRPCTLHQEHAFPTFREYQSFSRSDVILEIWLGHFSDSAQNNLGDFHCQGYGFVFVTRERVPSWVGFKSCLCSQDRAPHCPALPWAGRPPGICHLSSSVLWGCLWATEPARGFVELVSLHTLSTVSYCLSFSPSLLTLCPFESKLTYMFALVDWPNDS